MTAETESVMLAPSRELVQHATRELGYDERFTLYKMAASTGTNGVDVYNFPRLVNVLFGTRWDRLLLERGKEAIVWTDFDKLVTWLRDVIGDAEFADAVAAAVAEKEVHKDRMDAITPLFRERVAQYRAMLDELEEETA
jgi:hypothetical protein